MNKPKKNKTKVKSNGHQVIKPELAVARAVRSEPRFVLRFIGREHVERFTVPVLVLPRHD